MIDLISLVLLCTGVVLSTGRNLLSKRVSEVEFGTKRFFTVQACLFFTGTLLLAIVSIATRVRCSALSYLFALVYGVLLVTAQWNYTVALKYGKTGVCSTVYALGFVLPTLFGVLVFREKSDILDWFGVLSVIPAIVLAGSKKVSVSADGESQNGRFFIPLLIAMLCSGGLGIMQKVQQYSSVAEEKTGFTCLSFLVATLCSCVGALLARETSEEKSGKTYLYGSGVGGAFAVCNLLNVVLAGRLPSTVFFPVLNVGTIVCSLLFGILFFKERPTKKDACIFGLGALAIVLIGAM